MRGGRFQQKTSEDATIRNAEALFESRTVVEIREVEANTRREIEEKKEELRQLVGASYRDLIESADSIAEMKNSCENVALNIHRIQSDFASLKERLVIQHPSASLPYIDLEKKKREKIYGVGSRVKYVVDTPERIWGFLDEHMYLEAAQRYLRAHEVQTLLTEREGKGENLSHFPLLLHQWSLVETFQGQISQRSRDRLLEQGLDVQEYAIALAAVAVIDELSSAQIMFLFFETRRAWLRGHLRTFMSMTKDQGPLSGSISENKVDTLTALDVGSIALVLSKAANIIQVSLCHAGQLFLEVNGDLPLFFRTVMNSLPGSQLFGGIPNPEEEVKLWKRHWEKLESRTSSLTGEFISETCTSWINTCKSNIMVEGKTILELVEFCKELERIECLIRSECDSEKALEGSTEWLESAFGKAIESPWDYMTALLLKEQLNLWNILFEDIFVERAKRIMVAGLSVIDTENSIDDILSSTIISLSSDSQSKSALYFQVQGFTSTESMWFALTNKAEDLSETVARLLGKIQEEDSSGMSDSYLGPEVSQLKEGIHLKLKSLLEDATSFIQAQQNTARSEKLTPHLQKHCYEWMASFINGLLVKLLELSDSSGISTPKIDGLFSVKSILGNRNEVQNSRIPGDLADLDIFEISPSVEKALLLARIFMAFSQRTWSLPLMLQSSKSLQSNETKSSLPWLASSERRKFWLDVNDSTIEGRHIEKTRFSIDLPKEESHSEFGKLQMALKYASLGSHCIWVEWSAQRLIKSLTRSLMKDDDLASSAPLKGWEETPLRQVNEGGDEIEVRLPLPAMPSSYVISFLFRSCQEIYRIGGHALDKAVLQLFASSLLEKVLLVYEDFVSGLGATRGLVSEKGLLQLLFDVRFLGDVLAGGEHPYPDLSLFSSDEVFLASTLSSANVALLRKLLFQSNRTQQHRKRRLISLKERLSSLLDPIDWATYEPPLWENEQQAYQKCSVMLGFLVQLKHLYRDTAQRPPLNADPSILKVSVSIPRFTYLPISTPSLMKKSLLNENGVKLKTIISSQHAGIEDNTNIGSIGGAKPLLQSFINQVGTKFGEGTFKLGGYMLSDSQVSRIKDRSAAAISTFGDILPSQAAGLLSSFTAGSTTY